MEVIQIQTSRLRPWDANPRLNDHAVDAVAKSIEQFGFNVPIVCDQNYQIIAGHVRWKAAKQLRLERVPVIQLEMTEAQRDAFAIADNKTADVAQWDFAALTNILKDLDAAGCELPSLGFSDAELDALLEPIEEFDFSQFDDQLLAVPDRTHVLLAVKVPIASKGKISSAIRQYANEHAIADKESAVRAGRVFAPLLGIAE
jgi:ParB-like chromosome segregation protein Spo0J